MKPLPSGMTGAISGSLCCVRVLPAQSDSLSPVCHLQPSGHRPAMAGFHEIKHDGFRIMARRDSAGVRLITRHGNDFTSRFPLAVAAVTALPARSFLLDGEAIVTNDRGLAVFDLIRHKRHGADAVLLAFDLIELDGEDLRRTPIEQRKRKLAKLVRAPHAGIVLTRSTTATATSCLRTLASLAARASCRSGSARRTFRAFAALAQGQKPESARQ